MAATVSTAGARYVDGAIIGGPPDTSTGTRLYLSGVNAADVAALFRDPRLEVRVLRTGDPVTAASALKMCYAAWTKISAALLLSIDESAADHGVSSELRDLFDHSQPDLPRRLGRARQSAEAKGWRWSGEMEQIAASFAASGQPAQFGAAAAEVYRRYPRR